MKNYSTYVQEANILCSSALEQSNAEDAAINLKKMRENVSQSELTVYQKEFLLRQLGATHEAAYS